MKVSKGNNLISKSRAFHNVGAAYTKDLSKNELAIVILIYPLFYIVVNAEGGMEVYYINIKY